MASGSRVINFWRDSTAESGRKTESLAQAPAVNCGPGSFTMAGNTGVRRMVSVVVIMSTYNGMRYLREQLDSLLSQEGLDVMIWVRDDGSSEPTRRILTEYAATGHLQWVAGDNLGAGDSFMEALRLCPIAADYYGFCDQDDVWLPDKLAVAVKHLTATREEGPAMVCSTVTITEEDLTPRTRTAVPRRGLSFRNALVQTAMTGLSMVMNKPGFDLLRSAIPRRGRIQMHDAWAYLVFSAFGTIHFYDHPRVLYRQHASNVFGAGHSMATKIQHRIRRLWTKSRFFDQAQEFHRCFPHGLKPQDEQTLIRYIKHRDGVWRRLWFALRPSVECQRWQAQAYLRLLILLGRA